MLADAQGEEMDPFVWYTVPGIFTSSLKPASCPESLVVSSRTQGLLPEVTEAGALVAGGWGDTDWLVPEVRCTQRQLLLMPFHP
eukprot:4931597-Alexandrium_andersonii.AAC.1